MSERMNWDHHADHDLLTAMMQELQPSQEQLRGVMTRMHGFGYTCTVKAITQHLQKLRRKEDKAGAGAGNSNGEGPATPKTPGGRKKNAGGSVKKEPGSGTKRKPVALLSDDEDVKPAVKVKKMKEEEGVKEESDG
ncbi:predicted protein [Chaetomium globosum CBS 148.51]|uniref:Uncharacterized protein n=1 Tax=Chaetomium globosum (strain ATCC 6205 / CBS 148.51 / DSM 1962 / NBRC 6347 / NRRL 1970) TaxID=306901 RepID=Q2GP66_CHAGB|nr:uncharacterized protein CHGG_10238 [Chaetomium globosum CBS 148.51]EAQ83834.1 predicted protein [Chaetomium globosum CBS 148.51]